MSISFDWDLEKATVNRTKHNVSFEEAMTVFGDPLSLSRLDIAHGANEERWVTLGLATSGNLVLVVHTWTELNVDHALVRIISARRPTRHEARRYREGS